MAKKSEATPVTGGAKPWETAEQQEPAVDEVTAKDVSVEAEAGEVTDEPETAEQQEPAVDEAVDDGFVLATVPKGFRLTLDNHTVKEYPAGIQRMPKEHAEHWWAKSQGVEIYKGEVAGESAQAAKLKQLIDQRFQELESLPKDEREKAAADLFDAIYADIMDN